MAVSKSTFQVTLPTELIPFLEKLRGMSIDDKVMLSVAIELFVSKILSLGKAAEIADRSYFEFMDELKARGIPWLEYTEEDLRQDELAIKEILKESGENLF